MSKLLITFCDEAELLAGWARHLQQQQGAAPSRVVLLYHAAPRPARVKRWVSRGGWERMAHERARRAAAALTAQFDRDGLPYEQQVCFGASDASIAELIASAQIDQHLDTRGLQRARAAARGAEPDAPSRAEASAPPRGTPQRAAPLGPEPRVQPPLAPSGARPAVPVVRVVRRRLAFGA
jgi:hypothetical protein